MKFWIWNLEFICLFHRGSNFVDWVVIKCLSYWAWVPYVRYVWSMFDMGCCPKCSKHLNLIMGNDHGQNNLAPTLKPWWSLTSSNHIWDDHSPSSQIQIDEAFHEFVVGIKNLYTSRWTIPWLHDEALRWAFLGKEGLGGLSRTKKGKFAYIWA